MRSFKEIKNNIKRVKGLSTIGFTNFVAASSSGIFWLVIANLSGVEDYGKLTYLIAAGYVTFTLAFFGAKHHLLVFTAKEEKSQSTIYLFSIITGIIASSILFIIFYNFSLSLFVIASIIFGLITGEILGRSLYKEYLKLLITQRILLFCLGIGLFFPLGIDGVILGYALSLFPFSFKLISVFKQSKIELSIIKLRSGFIIHSYAHDLARTLSTFADKLIVLPLFGYALLGNYHLGIQAVLLMAILPQSVYEFILPKEVKGKNNKKLKLVTFSVSIIFVLLTYLLVPSVIPVLFPDFTEAVDLIRIASLAIIPITANTLFTAMFFASEKTRIIFSGSVVYIVVQFLGIVILGEIYGINGAAMALVIGASARTLCFVSAIKYSNFKKNHN